MSPSGSTVSLMKPPEPYRECWCRDPDTGHPLGRRCQKLGQKGHGAWYAQYEAPRGADGRRRRPRLGPYATKKAATEALAEALGRVRQGGHIEDRRTTFGEYLTRRLRWWESEAELAPSTLTSYREAIELYFRPGLGHVRLVDLRDSNFRDLHAAMRLINRDGRAAPDAGLAEVLRRLTETRATAAHVPGRLASTRPLTDARIRRVHAVALSALSGLVPHTLPYNPAAGAKVGGKRGQRKQRPLLWTEPRVERWRETAEIPAPVMVWTAAQCGAFLDSLEASENPQRLAERLYALFHLAAYSGMRRSELAGLGWADVDLDRARVHVRQAQVDDALDSTKSEESERQMTTDVGTVSVLREWRKVQLAERLAWGPAWTDSGRVFTREDGTALRPAWISQRFGAVIAREQLPPVRFHDLRHGAASMLLAAGQPAKVISERLGHATVAFTMDTYTEVAEELDAAAAAAIAAYIPRKRALLKDRTDL
jgi:integrase